MIMVVYLKKVYCTVEVNIYMVSNMAKSKQMLGMSCSRTVGGRCVGNCRKVETNNCMRTVGGRCVGNCRKTEGR